MSTLSSSIFHIIEHEVACQHIREYPTATSRRQEDILKLAVNQYIPLDNLNPQPGDVTIIAAHGSGLPKELYEPLWEELYARSKGSELRIRSIWIADVAHQGRSGLINESVLGNDPNWFDHTRDLLHLVNVKRAEMPRPIVGIGHSMGGTHLVQLSLIHPRLLHTLVLLDPVIQRPKTQLGNSHDVFDHKLLISDSTRLSTYRRDQWSSRKEAAESFRKSSIYQRWDKRVLDRWIEYGLRNLPTPLQSLDDNSRQTNSPPVTLTTTIQHEVTTFARPTHNNFSTDLNHSINHTTHPDLDPALITSFPFYRPEPSLVFEQLPHLRPSVMYIFGGKSHMCAPAMRMDKMIQTGSGVGGSGGAKAGRVQEVMLPGFGHLLAQEAVNECAEVAVNWLGPEMKRWREEEATQRELWGVKSTLRKAGVDDEWKKLVPSIKSRKYEPRDNNKASKL